LLSRNRLQVGVQYRVPVRLGCILDGSEIPDAGVVHQNRDRTERLLGLAYEPHDFIRVANVRRKRGDACAFGSKASRGFFEPLRFARAQRDLRPQARQVARDRETDAAARSRDQCDFIFQNSAEAHARDLLRGDQLSAHIIVTRGVFLPQQLQT